MDGLTSAVENDDMDDEDYVPPKDAPQEIVSFSFLVFP